MAPPRLWVPDRKVSPPAWTSKGASPEGVDDFCLFLDDGLYVFNWGDTHAARCRTSVQPSADACERTRSVRLRIPRILNSQLGCLISTDTPQPTQQQTNKQRGLGRKTEIRRQKSERAGDHNGRRPSHQCRQSCHLFDRPPFADLRARQIQVTVEVPAPEDKQWRGCIGWLLRRLGDAPDQTIIEAWPKKACTCHTASLSAVWDDRDLLAPDGKEPYKFRVALRAELALNRTNGGKRPRFVESVLGLVDTFYEQIVQNITPWQPPAPQAKKAIVAERDDEAGEAIRQPPPPVLVDGE